MCRRSALKVLNHALHGREGVHNCVKFVELYGLRTIFPFFMLPNKACKKNAISGMEQDEHVISILLSLLQNAHGSLKDRVLAKFIEKDMEKAERLVELHFVYKHRSSKSDATIARELESSEDETLDEEMVYLRRLDGGLFVLQQIDLIMVEAICNGPSFLKERLFKLLEQKRDSIASVKSVVSDFIEHMGDGIASDSDPSRSTELGEKKRLIELLRTL